MQGVVYTKSVKESEEISCILLHSSKRSFCKILHFRRFIPFLGLTRRIFAFTRALCLGETLVLLDVVSQGFFGNDGLTCNCFCIGMLKMQGYYLCIQAEV